MATEFKPSAPENPYSPPEVGLPAAAPEPMARQPLASRLSRLGAVMIDGLSFGVAVMPAVIIAVLFVDTESASWGSPMTLVFSVVSGLAVLALIAANLYLMSTRAQSVGKFAVGIKVVDLDGHNASLSRIAFLRVIPISLLGAIPFVGSLVQLIDAAMIFGEDRRCLHDLIAKTNVVVAD